MEPNKYRKPEYIKRGSVNWARTGSRTHYELSGWKGLLVTLLGLVFVAIASVGVLLLLLLGAFLSIGNALLGAIARPIFGWMHQRSDSHRPEESYESPRHRKQIIDAHYEVVSDDDSDEDGDN